MTVFRNKLRQIALFLLFGFALAAAVAPANACVNSLPQTGQSAPASCSGCGGSDVPDLDNWACSAPCPVTTALVTVSGPIEGLAGAPTFLHKNYPYADWLPSPSIPPPRSA